MLENNLINDSNDRLPIGFTMELAMHFDAMSRFSKLSKSEQDAIIEGSRNIKSHDEMRNYVESLFK